MRTLHSLLCLTAAGAAVAAAAQQPQTEPEAEPTPRYNVEIIVFAHNDVDPEEERFEPVASGLGNTHAGAAPPAGAILAIEPLAAADDSPAGATAATGGTAPPPAGPAPASAPDAPGTDGSTDGGSAAGDPLEYLSPFGAATRALDEIAPPAEPPFRLLSSDELQLNDARNIIARLRAYRLLGHGGWQQDGLPESEAIDFSLANLGITNPSGTVRLYLRRFLHFGVDLEYRVPPGLRLTVAPDPAEARVVATDPAGAPAADGVTAAPPSPLRGSAPRPPSPLEEIEIPQRVSFATERNAIRSGELHYIDHPLFGILVLITPAPEPEESDTEAAATDQPAA